MAEKRRFYNAGEAKGFTKAVFFEAVKALIEGEDLPDAATEQLILDACDYELESISLRSKSGSGEKKDALESEYATKLAQAIIPLVDATPRSVEEILAIAAERGIFSDKVDDTGNPKPYAAPWVARVLSGKPGIDAGVEKVSKIVEKKNAKGLVSQKEVTAYKRG